MLLPTLNTQNRGRSRGVISNFRLEPTSYAGGSVDSSDRGFPGQSYDSQRNSRSAARWRRRAHANRGFTEQSGASLSTDLPRHPASLGCIVVLGRDLAQLEGSRGIRRPIAGNMRGPIRRWIAGWPRTPRFLLGFPRRSLLRVLSVGQKPPADFCPSEAISQASPPS